MDRQQALLVVGLDSEASHDQVAQAVQVQTDQLVSRIKTAPTAALRDKYASALREISEAARHLGVITNFDFPAEDAAEVSQNHDTPLSSTKLYDLPSASPIGAMAMSRNIDDQSGLKAGQVLAGRYTVRALVGMGGMGAVYSAYDQNLGEDIAVKALTPSLLRNEQARERFLNEAKTYSRLSHENIVNVHDVQRDGELYFITMELLRGCNLRQELLNRQRTNTPFTLDEVKNIARQVGAALDYAHGTTVHRDVKPENIWIGANSQVKLMDFGIARMLSTGRMTQTAMVMGSAGYMAPEQLSGQADYDGRADQYALGVVIYEMLTGTVPGVRMKPLYMVRPDVGQEVSEAVDRALEQNPNDRFRTLAEFTLALDKARGPRGRAGKPLMYAAAAIVIGGVAYGAVATEPGQKVVTFAKDYFQEPAPTAFADVTEKADSVILDLKNTPPSAKSLAIYRSEDKADNYELIADNISADAASFTDEGLEEKKTYYYKIAAVNSAGKIADLAKAGAVTANTLPSQVARPTEVKADKLSTNEIQLSWKGRFDPGTTIEVLRSETPDGEFVPVTENTIAAENLEFIDNNELKPGTEYHYRLTAKYRTVASAMATAKGRTRSEPPMQPEVKPGEMLAERASFMWSPDVANADATIIEILQSEFETSGFKKIEQTPTLSTGKVDIHSLKADTAYYFKFVAIYDGERSPDTKVVSVKTKAAAPDAVTNLQAKVTSPGKLKLTWSPPSVAPTGYYVEKLEGDSNTIGLGETNATETFKDVDWSPAVDTEFRVMSMNQDVKGEAHAIRIPAAPAGLTVTGTDSAVDITWTNASKFDPTFHVFRMDTTNVATEINKGLQTATSTRDITIQPGETYRYYVEASTEKGRSRTEEKVVEVPPDAPTLETRVEDNRVVLTWPELKAKAKIARYQLERTGGDEPLTKDLSASEMTYSDTDVKPGKQYTYQLKAITANSAESVSSPATVVAKASPTPAPKPPEVAKPAPKKESAKPTPKKEVVKKEEPVRDPSKYYESKPGQYAVREQVNGRMLWRYATKSEIEEIKAGGNQRIIGTPKVVAAPPTPVPTPMPQPPAPPPQQQAPQYQPQQQQIDPAAALLGLAVGAAVLNEIIKD